MSLPKKVTQQKGTSKKKSPSKPKPKSTAKGSGKKGKTGAVAGKLAKSAFLPLFSVWFIAIVVLAGLLYWAKGDTGLPQSPRPAVQQKTSRQEGTKPLRTHKHSVEPDRLSHEANHHPAITEGFSSHDTHSFTEQEIPPTNPDQGSKPARPSQSNSSHNNLTLALNRPLSPPPPPPPAPPSAPIPPPTIAPVARVAIVIDDFGWDLKAAQQFLTVPLPLTFSVLPFRPHSERIVQLVHAHGHEAILHIPMEPLRYPEINPGRGALLVSMSAEQIRDVLRRDLDAYPYIAGINNHMGSRFTEDSRDMRIVLDELHQRGLFFLDSYTTDRSVGYTLARTLGVPTARRDVFLDDKTTESAIRFQINRLIRKAKIQGSAIAIGHPHPVTYRVLCQEADHFRQEHIEVVPLKTLILHPNHHR